MNLMTVQLYGIKCKNLLHLLLLLPPLRLRQWYFQTTAAVPKTEFSRFLSIFCQDLASAALHKKERKENVILTMKVRLVIMQSETSTFGRRLGWRL